MNGTPSASPSSMDRQLPSEGIALRHPTPDLQSLQGACMGNVERLEHEAERLSSGGSDLAENIRKLKAEQKLSESRRESLRSTPTPAEEGRPFPFNRSRNTSTSSYSNSIVDVNNAARWGGYSPGGYVTSPVGSLRSGSWSHRSTQMARSTSRTSRLTQLPEPEQEGRPLDSPLIGSSPVPTVLPPQPPNRRSFSREYENIAQEIRDQLVSISPEHIEEPDLEDQDPTERYEDMAHEIRAQLDMISSGHSEHVNEHEEHFDEHEERDDEYKGHSDGQDGQDEHAEGHDERHVDEQDEHIDEHTDPIDRPVGGNGFENTKSKGEAVSSEHEGSKDDEPDIEFVLYEPQDFVAADTEDDDGHGQHLGYRKENQDRALTPPDRPATAASTDTYQQAVTLFHDFDGVHYAPSIRPRDEELEDDDVPSLRNHPLTRADLTRPKSYIEPPPSDDMVFYPAPVPRTLNLPQRLSQLPNAALQAKRRSQLVGALPADVRKSAAWLPQPDPHSDNISERPTSQDTSSRHSKDRMDLAALPPQLRASAYFEHPSISQDVEVRGESAVATLDSILEASATAPVGAFTNHPISGASGSEVFSREIARRSVTSPIEKVSLEKKKNRSTLDLLLGRRKSSDPSKIMHKANSSKLSLGTQLNGTEANEGDPVRDPGEEGEEEVNGEEDEEDQETEEQFFGPPSTLLAELQLRKLQQKQRNRTAATAFPNGMHSTLLELDAVAQVEKRRRMAQRPALAWEDSEARAAEDAEADDDDVPLGMLFPGRDGLVNRGKGVSDWDRPLGLIEKRELEENEPLSRRRARLRGVSPNKRGVSPGKRATGMPVGEGEPEVQPPEAKPEEADEEEEEPLAQRLRRLKNRESLNAALGDIAQRPMSTDFASEIMSQLGGFDDSHKDAFPTDATAPAANDEEETLGQRRKRLQAEALAATHGPSSTTPPQPRNISNSSDPPGPSLAAAAAAAGPTSTNRPSLKPTRSLADLLSANPINTSRHSSAEQNHTKASAATAPVPGTLLHQNASRQERRRTKMMEQNRRAGAEGGLDAPLVDVPRSQAALLAAGGGGGGAAAGGNPVSQGFAGGVYNNGAGGAVSTPGVGYAAGAGAGAHVAGGLQSPPMVGAAGMGTGNGMGAMSAPLGMGMGVGVGMHGMPTPMSMGMGMSSPMNMNMNMGVGVGMGYQAGMNGYFNNMAVQNHALGYNTFQQPMGGMGMGMSTGLGMPGYGQNIAMGPGPIPESAMNQKQREMIDRWRQSIA
ncbi:MAG: hypothetical protein Q9165_000539 [Trypethelium subeluteriae]